MLDSPFLTVSQAAKLLHVKEETIQRQCREGVLPAARAGKRWLIDTSGELGTQPMSQRGDYPTTGRLR